MSNNNNTASPVHAPLNGRESMATSSAATTEKYPASAASNYNSYPEVAPVMTQPALEHYQQPNAGYQHQYQYQNGYAPAQEQPPQQKQKNNPWGLSPLAFGLIVAAITAVIVGGAVGGGVAGAMSGNDNSKSSR